MIKTVFKTFPSGCSVHYADYMGRRFYYPVYAWPAFEPFWDSMLIGISKTLIYHKFTPACYKDHSLWRKQKQGLEALRFADLLSRDRDVANAIKEFNKQAPGGMKYGGWLEPMHGDTPHWPSQITQFGQWITNSMVFLRNTGYTVAISGSLGLKILRPYWLMARQDTVMREWLLRTFRWMRQQETTSKKLPALGEIAEHWRIPRYGLVDEGLTREIIYEMYRLWKAKGIGKILKIKRTRKLITKEDAVRIAYEVVKRIS